MIEPIMFFGIGFLVASLFGLVLVPLVHNRAVRLTMRRLEAATPLSMAEIQADKDQLRAEFAMSTRRLELSVEQMKAKTTSQLAELGKKTDAINRLKVELGEKTAAIFSLEARERALKDQLQATEAEHSMKIGALREAERMLADKQAELAKISADLGERRRGRQPAPRGVRAARPGRGAQGARHAHEREAHEIGDRLTRERQDAAAATAELNEARGKVDKLSERVMELERALVAQTTEAEVLGRRVPELETRMNEQGKTLSDREARSPGCNETLAAAQKTETDLRAELASAVEPQPLRDRGPRQGKGADRGSARPVESRAHQAAAGNRRHEARGRADLGGRAGGERAAARTHQRHRSRNRPPHHRARRRRFADRGDARRRLRPPTGRVRSTASASPRRRAAKPRAILPIGSAPCSSRRRGFRPRADPASRTAAAARCACPRVNRSPPVLGEVKAPALHRPRERAWARRRSSTIDSVLGAAVRSGTATVLRRHNAALAHRAKIEPCGCAPGRSRIRIHFSRAMVIASTAGQGINRLPEYR